MALPPTPIMMPSSATSRPLPRAQPPSEARPSHASHCLDLDSCLFLLNWAGLHDHQIARLPDCQIARSSHHHIITSSHHHIITSSHHHIITSSHHHIITSSHHRWEGETAYCGLFFLGGGGSHPGWSAPAGSPGWMIEMDVFCLGFAFLCRTTAQFHTSRLAGGTHHIYSSSCVPGRGYTPSGHSSSVYSGWSEAVAIL